MKNNHSRPTVKGFVNIRGHVWGIVGILCFAAIPTPNTMMTIGAILSLPIFAMLTWRKSEPAILFFALCVQWLAIAIKIIYANSLGVTVEELSGYPQINNAIWYGLAGLVCMATGMRLGIRKFSPPEFDKVRQEINDLVPSRIFIVFCLVFVAAVLSQAVSVGRVRQIVLAMTQVQWVFFLLLAYCVISTKKNKIYLVLALLAEVILGFFGFFSEFKKPFMFLFIVLLSLGYRFKLRSLINAFFVAAITISLGVFWTAIKPEYRAFLNKGTGAQVSLVSPKEKVAKIAQLYSDLKVEDVQNGIEALAERVAYVDFFAIVLSRVPSVIAHENGEILKGALRHVLMPRLFFPNKPIIDDSAMTLKYTGKASGEHTSISLGYMAHLYIDFGVVGMLVAVLFIGIGFGLIYQMMMGVSRTKLVGYVGSMVVLLSISSFGSDLSKLLGGSIMLFLVMTLFLKVGWPLIGTWCMPGSKKKSRLQ